eukprot:scaffold261277_cov32-Prasinocladus_malaysianus.AAC.1
MAAGDPACLAEGVHLLTELHLSDEPHYEFEYQPSFSRRGPQRFCGLKNAGATCYMNATIQQLFMTSGLRQLLLQANDIPEIAKADSVLYQLQVMFAHLALSSLDFHVPRNFWQAYKDYDGEPINLREHQDAFEFLTRLQDLVDQPLSDTQQTKVMKTAMGGKFAQQCLCRFASNEADGDDDVVAVVAFAGYDVAAVVVVVGSVIKSVIVDDDDVVGVGGGGDSVALCWCCCFRCFAVSVADVADDDDDDDCGGV